MHRTGRHRPAPLAVGFAAIVAAVLVGSSADATNDRAVLVLHALPASVGATCGSPGIADFDCSSPAAVSVVGGELLDIFLIVHDFDDMSALQCRFLWDLSWTFHSWQENCGGNQIVISTVQGPVSWELVTAFDPITRVAGAAPIGRLRFTSGAASCLTIGESTNPFGTHLVSADAVTVTPVPEARRGAVCADRPGIDGCGLGTAFQRTSWGAIKAGYDP
ncbi:MAG: hypothetical protein PVF43_07150 [Candidatus Eiseniibacteriota bacterium]|jgi:hypothetical protein